MAADALQAGMMAAEVDKIREKISDRQGTVYLGS